MKTLFSLLLLPLLLCNGPVKGQAGRSLADAIDLKNLADVTINVRQKDVSLTAISSQLNTPATGCKPGACNALPVTLLSFEGHRTDVDDVLLKWKTTNELNSVGFDVERSLGNTNQFMKVAFVSSLSNDYLIKNYELTDDNSFAGTSYYRLKQIDIDSQFTYSRVIAIGNTGEKSLTLYPNPATSILYLKIVSPQSGNAGLVCYDANGKVVMQQKQFIQKGINLTQMNVSALAPGMYFMRLQNDEGTVLVQSFTKK